MLFDGKCNLCNAGVQLILDYDRADADKRGNLRVAAMQSQVGQLLLQTLSEKQRNIVLGGNEKDINNNKKKKRVEETNHEKEEEVDNADDDDEMEYKSIVVVTPNKIYLNSNACLQIGRELSGPLRTLSHLAGIILPPFLRDVVYKLLSKNRKRFFGSSNECRLWDENWDTRFVDNAVIMGKQQLSSSMVVENNPFADPNAVIRNKDNGTNHNNNTRSNFHAGDTVRVVLDSSASSSSSTQTSQPMVAVHTTHNIPGYSNGRICTVGSVGTVTRVLDDDDDDDDGREYPGNVAVKFELDISGYYGANTAITAATAGENSADVEQKGATTTCSFEAHFFPWQLRKE